MKKRTPEQQGNRIAYWRAKREMTQGGLAEKLRATFDDMDTNQVAVSRLEQGKVQLNLFWLERLATVLDVTPTDLLPEQYHGKQLDERESDIIQGFREVSTSKKKQTFEAIMSLLDVSKKVEFRKAKAKKSKAKK